MPSQIKLTEQQQYEFYGKLCNACDKYENFDVKEIERLLDSGVCAYNKKWEADNKTNCLHLLVRSANKLSFEQFISVFNRLCEAGADPKYSKVSMGGSLLTDAIFGGHCEIMIWLIKEKGFAVNGRNGVGDTPLFDAINSARGDKVKIVQALLDLKADPWLRNEQNKLPWDIAPLEVKRLLPEPKPTISQQQAWNKKPELKTSFIDNIFNYFNFKKSNSTNLVKTNPYNHHLKIS